MALRAFSRIVSLAFLFLSGPYPSSPQNLPDPQTPVSGGVTIKAESRAVLVDVVVTDKQGKNIARLAKEDFQVLEDGVLQVVSGFEEHKGISAREIKLPPMPSNVFTNFPTTQSADSVNVLLLDMLNTQPQDQAIVRKAINKFLENIPPGTRMAVFALGKDLRIVRGFTSDFSGLATALDDKRLTPPTDMQRTLPTEAQMAADNKPIEQMRRSNASPLAIGALQDFQRDRSFQLQASRTDITLQALQHIARYLSGIPARKNVIWLSDYFPVTFFPDSKARIFANPSSIKKTSDILTAAQVAIYPVSALGILGDPTFDVSELGGTRQQLEQRLSINQIAMETIAQETGGRAFYNTNALGDAVQDAVGNGSHYYTISYSPASGKLDGKFHKIEVKSSRLDCTLSYRRGYYADKPAAKPFSEESEEDPLLPLVGFGMPNFDQILYKVLVSKKNPQPPPNAPVAGTNSDLKPPLLRYDANLAVMLQDLALSPDKNGIRRGNIEIMLLAFDPEGRILNIVRKRDSLVLSPAVYSATLPVGMQIHEEIDVPPGDVYLRVGVYDRNSGKCGTVGIPLAKLPADQSSLN